MSRQSVIDYAVELWNKNTDVEADIFDAMIWSMEQHDTDDMPQSEIDALLNDIKKAVNQ